MCIQNLVSFCQFVLKILSKNQILTSIKGCNSVAKLRKTTIYNIKVDLVNDNVYTKFGLNQSICFQDIEQKLNSDVIKGSNSVANLLKFELIQAFMHVLLTCKNEVDQIKNERARVLPFYGEFSRCSMAANSAVLGPIWPNFELIRDLMDVIITCKYEEDPSKNEGARVVTTLYINISEGQGQITLVLVVVSGRNLNSSKLSCMSFLPARMRMIKSKMKELECSQDFSHYKSMGIFPDAHWQLTPQSLVRSGRISNSSEMFLMFFLPASMKKIRSKMKALEWSQHFYHYNPMGAIGCHGHQSSDPI